MNALDADHPERNRGHEHRRQSARHRLLGPDDAPLPKPRSRTPSTVSAGQSRRRRHAFAAELQHREDDRRRRRSSAIPPSAAAESSRARCESRDRSCPRADRPPPRPHKRSRCGSEDGNLRRMRLMGRKSSSKNHTTPPAVPAQSRSGPNPLLSRVDRGRRDRHRRRSRSGAAATLPRRRQRPRTATTPAADAPKLAKGAEPTPEIIAATAAQAALGPHKQANLPPLPFRGYAPPRPVEVVDGGVSIRRRASRSLELRAVLLRLRARRPQGQRRLLRPARAANGDVIEWEAARHGLRGLHRRRDALAADARVRRIGRATSAPRSRRNSRRASPTHDADAASRRRLTSARID